MMLNLFTVAALLPASVLAQERPKVATVCEILSNPNEYRGSAIAVVGRLYTISSLIDESEFLTQDKCEKPIVTKRFRWPNMILIWPHSEDGFPKPPTDEPALDQELVAKKLAIVRKNTKLGVHEEPRITVKDGSTTYSQANVPNEWAVAYGRIISSANLSKEPCNNDDIGCRGFMGAPIAITVEPRNIRLLNEDGTSHDPNP